MGTYICYRACAACVFGFHPPAVVRIQKHPVLSVRAIDGEDFSQVAVGYHISHLLDNRISAHVEINSADLIHLLAQINQFVALLHFQSEGLFTDNVLTCKQRLFGYLIVEVVRCADVYGFDFRVGKQLLVVGVCFRHPEFIGLFLGLPVVGSADCHHLGNPRASHCFHMYRPYKSEAHNSYINFTHFFSFPPL